MRARKRSKRQSIEALPKVRFDLILHNLIKSVLEVI